jgi:hypothetical protein
MEFQADGVTEGKSRRTQLAIAHSQPVHVVAALIPIRYPAGYRHLELHTCDATLGVG